MSDENGGTYSKKESVSQGFFLSSKKTFKYKGELFFTWRAQEIVFL